MRMRHRSSTAVSVQAPFKRFDFIQRLFRSPPCCLRSRLPAALLQRGGRPASKNTSTRSSDVKLLPTKPLFQPFYLKIPHSERFVVSRCSCADHSGEKNVCKYAINKSSFCRLCACARDKAGKRATLKE